MICEECRADMWHSYCETWTTGGDPFELVEYITLRGYWSCHSCGYTIDEDDGGCYEPD